MDVPDETPLTRTERASLAWSRGVRAAGVPGGGGGVPEPYRRVTTKHEGKGHAAPVDPATLRFLLEQTPTAALALVGLWMFAAGKLHSSAELNRAIKDLDTERAAHEQTRAALALASARADAGIRAAELVAGAVEGARHVPQAPA